VSAIGKEVLLRYPGIRARKIDEWRRDAVRKSPLEQIEKAPIWTFFGRLPARHMHENSECDLNSAAPQEIRVIPGTPTLVRWLILDALSTNGEH